MRGVIGPLAQLMLCAIAGCRGAFVLVSAKSMFEPTQILAWVAIASGTFAAVILVTYLVRRPPLVRATKLWLFFGLGPLPIASALMGNLANLEVSKERRFCGSCHVMTPYIEDAQNRASHSLAAVHSRNAWFGDQSCYVCHADYGMFGTATTKIGGLRHVWDYYAHDWRSGERKPKLYKPYKNSTCMRCHPQEGNIPLAHEVHSAMLNESRVSCAAKGCHGPPHPTQNEPAVTESAGAAYAPNAPAGTTEGP